MSDAGDLEGKAIVDRYQLKRRIGVGGMGVVYEAFDAERRANVALKVMRSTDAAALYRFKKEFRVLADLHHKNVVSLHELVATSNRWFLTMELIDGVNFRDYVRDSLPTEGDTETKTIHPKVDSRPLRLDTFESPEGTPPPRPHPPGVLDEARLRAALRQLCEGVAFLHRSRCLHRDIKPSNVLVSAEGRVVLCDFGLVKELAPDLNSKTFERRVTGTVSYMSPEQARGDELTEASDWYSVGVMLYEALTGQLPFVGDRESVLLQKLKGVPTPPRLVDPTAPADLSALCLQLMAVRPNERPPGPTVLDRLGAVRLPLPAPSMEAVAAAPFLGRKRELAVLERAFGALAEGTPTTVLVEGTSGMGKSALLLEFLERVRDDNAIALAGRCYERESVPYKGFDSVVDALSAYMLKLPAGVCETLVPRDVTALSRLFPVLRRVDAIEDACVADFEVPDPQESRHRAIAALRELLTRVSRSETLVLCIDDLQWGDADSAHLLADILRPPDAPKLLALLSYRSDEAATAPALQALHAQRTAGAFGTVVEVKVGALPMDEATALAAESLGRGPHRTRAAAVAAESGGSPFFIGELARYILAGAPSGAEVSLDEVLSFRIGQLPADARALLSVVAVAGRPLPQGVALNSADLQGDPVTAIGELRHQHMIRVAGVRESDRIETYHDRIREAVVRTIGGQALAATHARLARAYELKGDVDAEILVEHWRSANRPARASEHAAVAAEHAMTAFAFDRAARLYRVALELGEQTAGRQRMRVQLAEALANAGRGAEAAEAFLEAAEGATTADSLECRRRAAECWLHTGHFDRGMDAMKTVLESIGLTIASSPGAALSSLIRRRLWLKLRGLGYKRRDSTQVASEELTRIDILRSIATGLTMIDVIHGADFNTRHLLAALRAGEPLRVARALAVEAAHSATQGGKTWSRTTRLVAAANALATELEDPAVIGLVKAVSGVAAFLAGEWRTARDLCREADQLLRDKTRGTTWETMSAQSFELASMFYLGELRELADVVPARLREAEKRGNLWVATGLRSWRTNSAWLVLDDPDEARREVDKADRQWSRDGFHLQHWYELLAHVQIDLYLGLGRAGLDRIELQSKAMQGSLLLRIQNIRVESAHLRARCAVAAAKASGEKALLAMASKAARTIEKEGLPWTSAIARMIDANVAAIRGDNGTAGLLAAAEKALTAADMHLYAAVTSYRRGQMIGGGDGSAIATTAREKIATLGAKNPTKMADMVMPGI